MTTADKAQSALGHLDDFIRDGQWACDIIDIDAFNKMELRDIMQSHLGAGVVSVAENVSDGRYVIYYLERAKKIAIDGDGEEVPADRYNFDQVPIMVFDDLAVAMAFAGVVAHGIELGD